MAAPDIPDVVRRLIADKIDSIPELEAILLLRQDRTRAWSVEESSKALFVSLVVAGYILGVLTERGFFACSDGNYRFAPDSPELEAAVDLLAATYSRRLVEVTHLVHAKPSASVRLFADAFRLRKDK
jgi:hypothetical protein